MQKPLVLIVEDNPTFGQSLQELLTVRFPTLDTDIAVDGKQALSKVAERVPVLVFIDIKLPGMNGLEVMKRLKEDYPEMFFIVLTCYDLLDYREVSYRLGANYFFTKGIITSEEIASALARLL